MTTETHTLSVLVENQPGVLARPRLGERGEHPARDPGRPARGPGIDEPHPVPGGGQPPRAGQPDDPAAHHGDLRLALLVRVLGTWFNQGRYSPWTRWAYPLTDWFMVPLQRVVPTLGMLDITPIVAYVGLGLLQSVVARAVTG